VEPGDVAGMARAIAETLDRVRADPHRISSTARSEAERLFAPELVCEQISQALEGLVGGVEAEGQMAAVAQDHAST